MKPDSPADSPPPAPAPALHRLARLAEPLRTSALLDRFPAARRAARGVYRVVVRKLSGPEGMDVEVNGVERFRMVNHFSERLDWEPEIHRLLDKLAAPGMTGIDVGAHCGIFAMAMARRVGPAGRVIAFEPAPDSFDALQTNARANGLSDRILAENAVVGDGDGETDFHWFPGLLAMVNTAGETPRARAGVEPQTRRLPMTTLDAYCRNHGIRPDLIKIDTEGYELNVLRGARELLAARGKLTILVEVHPDRLRELGQSEAEVRTLLNNAGFEIEPVREAGSNVDSDQPMWLARQA